MRLRQKNLGYLAKKRLEEKDGYFKYLKGCHVGDVADFICCHSVQWAEQ